MTEGILFSVIYVLFAVSVAALAYRLGMKKKFTRKIVHILAGGEYFILTAYFGTTWKFTVAAAAFTLALLAAYLTKCLPMVSSDTDNDPGTVYFGCAMTLISAVQIFVPAVNTAFGLAVLCTSVGDGAAGIVGMLLPEKKNPKLFGKKTLFGTLSMFLFAFASCFVLGLADERFAIGILPAAAVALLAAEAELLSTKGLDNLTVPLAACALASAFILCPTIAGYLLPILMTVPTFVFAKCKEALTKSGIIAAVALDTVVTACLGNAGFGLMLFFFAGGVLTDKCKKKSASLTEAKPGARDAAQVFANGGVGAIAALFYLVTGRTLFFVAYAAAFAEALADTAASGIGSRASRVYDLARFRRCTPGESGGVSLVGSLAALVGSLSVASLSLLFLPSWQSFAVVGAAGVLGCFVDSLLGSTLQARFRCPVCAELTEKRVHHGERTYPARGLAFLDNDGVNLVSVAFAAVAAAVVFAFLPI